MGEGLFLTSEVKNFAAIGRADAYDKLQRSARITRSWGDAYGYLLHVVGREHVGVAGRELHDFGISQRSRVRPDRDPPASALGEPRVQQVSRKIDSRGPLDGHAGDAMVVRYAAPNGDCTPLLARITD